MRGTLNAGKFLTKRCQSQSQPWADEQQQSGYRPISEPQYLPTRHLSEARIFTAEGDEEHSAAFVRDLVDKEIIRSTGASTTLYG